MQNAGAGVCAMREDFTAMEPGFESCRVAQAIDDDDATWRVRDHLTYGIGSNNTGLQRFNPAVSAAATRKTVPQFKACVAKLAEYGFCELSADNAWVWVFDKASVQFRAPHLLDGGDDDGRSATERMKHDNRFVRMWCEAGKCTDRHLRAKFVARYGESHQLVRVLAGAGATSAIGLLWALEFVDCNELFAALQERRHKPKTEDLTRTYARALKALGKTFGSPSTHNQSPSEALRKPFGSPSVPVSVSDSVTELTTTRATPPRSVPVAALPLREKDPEPIEEDMGDAPGLPLELEPPRSAKTPAPVDEVFAKWNEIHGSRFTPKNKTLTSAVNARLDEGHTVDEFALVAEWVKRGDKRAAKLREDGYAVPSTAWAPSHFSTYLELAKTWKASQRPPPSAQPKVEKVNQYGFLDSEMRPPTPEEREATKAIFEEGKRVLAEIRKKNEAEEAERQRIRDEAKAEEARILAEWEAEREARQ